MTVAEAIKHLQKTIDGDFSAYEFDDDFLPKQAKAIAAILNAALKGKLK